MITIDFSKRNNFGLCEFLYESIKEQIQTGILKADEKLPSKGRWLAIWELALSLCKMLTVS